CCCRPGRRCLGGDHLLPALSRNVGDIRTHLVQPRNHACSWRGGSTRPALDALVGMRNRPRGLDVSRDAILANSLLEMMMTNSNRAAARLAAAAALLALSSASL